jgi:hypothetical protein
LHRNGKGCKSKRLKYAQKGKNFPYNQINYNILTNMDIPGMTNFKSKSKEIVQTSISLEQKMLV